MTGRGGKGVITYKITPKTGDIVGIRIVSGDEDVMMITDTGTIIRLRVADISILSRSTQGVTLMRTNDGKVVSITTLEHDEEADEEENQQKSEEVKEEIAENKEVQEAEETEERK